MATSFDATARINLDIRAFAQGAQAVTKQGGQMEKVFQNLNQVIGKVALVEDDLAKKLKASLTVYNQIISATKNYASAVQALSKNEQSGAKGAELMVKAFQQLRSALAQIAPLGEKEFQRIQRTIVLYERMAKVIQTLASAQKSMSSVTQNAITAEQKEAAARQKAAQAAAKQALDEQKLALAKERLAASTAASTQKMALEEQKLALAREKAAQAAQRSLTAEERTAQTRQRLVASNRQLDQSQVSVSSSTFALRNSIGQLEQGFQNLLNVVQKIPTAMASAAISQEQAFAQVARVVGEAEAASVGLLERFQEIAQSAPISFEEVARIGQLGAAIGVSEQNLGDFTDTIVKFSLTTGVASEEATILLGRIAQMQNVPISEIDQLGSAILALGTASAATDQEILRVNASIATVSNLFGLTAQETAGLSAALATLQVRPELSRGALTRVFNELTLAIADGGTELSKLGKVMNLTDEEVTRLFNNPAMRGEFLQQFIQGLSQFAGAGGDVQGVLRELGINAVRDIDVFSRLANNFDIVKESFERANTEFARGSELNRQSKGIYETTAAEIQNLSDAFQTLLANLGGPLAKALGGVASFIADEVLAPIAHLGPVIPILGTLVTVVTAAGAAWLIYQIALSKTISSMIAARELQKNLGVSTLNLRTAFKVFRGELDSTVAAETVMVNATRELAGTTQTLAGSLARSQAGMRAYAAAAESSALGLGTLSAATVAASRNMNTMFQAAATQRGVLTQLNTAGSATALAMTGISAANIKAADSQKRFADASGRFAGQTALAAGAVSGLNRSTVQTVPLLSGMSTNMQRAAQAGASLGSGFTVAGNAGRTAATAFTNVATTTTRVGLAARAASFAFGPWGLALTTIAILLGPMISDMAAFSSEGERIAASAMEATGGTQALANAIKADTETFKQTGQAYRTISISAKDMADATKRSAETARDSAKEQLRAIELVKGSSAELDKQAQGHDEGAQAASRYLREIDKASGVVERSTDVLKENTVAIGEQTKQWLLDTAQAAASSSKLADGSKRSQEALKQLGDTSVDVGDVLTRSLDDPKGATKELDDAIKQLEKTMETEVKGGIMLNSGPQLNETGEAARRARDFLEALRETVGAQESELTKNALAADLLKNALDDTGKAATSMSGNVKLGREALEELDTTAEAAQTAIDELAKTFEGFGTPLTAFKAAAESAFEGAADAVGQFSLKSKGGLDAYLKELDKISKAQRDWSANLIKIATTLGPDVAEQFRKLGPEAAPALAELVDLSAEELEKLGPRLREIGSTATSDLAASIIANSGKVENASIQTRKIIADVFGNAIDEAKTAEDFAKVSNQYKLLVEQLNKSKIKIDITADQAKALDSLDKVRVFIDLLNTKSIKPDVAIDIVGALGDLTKLQTLIAEAQASGKLDATGKAKLDSILFQAQLTQLSTLVKGLQSQGQFDANGKAKLDDTETRTKVEELKEFLRSQEGQGLLNPKGKAQLSDTDYRAQMQALATAILGKEAAGAFDVNGDGILSDDEFLKLLRGLEAATRATNRGKLDVKGKADMANYRGFTGTLDNMVQYAYDSGRAISRNLSTSATVSVGYYYYQKNSPPATAYAASGGWIHGPGGPTSDSIPAMLSDGEFVVNAAAARRFGALLQVINGSGGQGMAGVARMLGMNQGPKLRPIQLATNTGSAMMNRGLVQQATPEPITATAGPFTPQSSGGPRNVFNINNMYPQAEPTSMTINRSLAYAATISGV